MFELKNISKKLGSFRIENLSLKIDKGDYCTILGVSGAGKSILLEMIAGLIKPDIGTIILNGEDITHKKIQNRNMGLLFQDYAVFPHLTVRQNIEYPLISKRKSKSEKKQLVHNIAAELNIEHLLNRKPDTLSGGELQRTALARTLVTDPHILLLDEPLSSLDIILKNELRTLLRQLNKNGLTIIHVTHDYEEVISLANRIAVIENGKLIQEGLTKEVMLNPRTKFIAHLSGYKNFFEAYITNEKSTDKKVALLHNDFRVLLTTDAADEKGYIIINSNEIIVSEHKLESSAVNNFEGVVLDVIQTILGVEVCIDIGIIIYVTLTRSSFDKFNIVPEKRVWVCFKATGVRFFN